MPKRSKAGAWTLQAWRLMHFNVLCMYSMARCWLANPSQELLCCHPRHSWCSEHVMGGSQLCHAARYLVEG